MLIQETVHSQILIKSNLKKVWDAFINPEKIRQYLFGTTAISSWEKGAELIFTGDYEGSSYLDKGTILEIIPEKKLSYTYLSSFSGLPDLPENYSVITYHLSQEKDGIQVAITQKGFVNMESKAHSEKNWSSVLNSIKQLVESD